MQITAAEKFIWSSKTKTYWFATVPKTVRRPCHRRGFRINVSVRKCHQRRTNRGTGVRARQLHLRATSHDKRDEIEGTSTELGTVQQQHPQKRGTLRCMGQRDQCLTMRIMRMWPLANNSIRDNDTFSRVPRTCFGSLTSVPAICDTMRNETKNSFLTLKCIFVTNFDGK